jgi:hypothetical protein
MEGAESLADQLKARNPETPVEVIRGASYHDSRTAIVVPTRGFIHHQPMASFIALTRPMNTATAWLVNVGDEVSRAYNNLFRTIIHSKQTGDFPFILTLEDDMVIPADAHLRLLHHLHARPDLTAVSGLYYQKCKGGMPLILGDPAKFQKGLITEFTCIEPRPGLVECSAIPMGCALWRTQPFREMTYPWFIPDGMGQDIEVCSRLKREKNAKFAVDCDLRVGHLDVRTETLY